MRTCCCTNQCPACGQCCQVGCAHRGSASGWTAKPNTTTIPLAPVPVSQPLTEEDVRRIIREELERARKAA